MTKQRILIPLDGSTFSRQVIDYVRRIFTPADAELMLLRVAPPEQGLVPNPPRTISAAWMTPLYSSAQDAQRAHHPIYVSQAEESVIANHEADLLPDVQLLEAVGYTVISAVRFGEAATTIVASAQETNAALIAMATHGWSGLRHLLLGSVAEHVLRISPIPVLLVRPIATHN